MPDHHRATTFDDGRAPRGDERPTRIGMGTGQHLGAMRTMQQGEVPTSAGIVDVADQIDAGGRLHWRATRHRGIVRDSSIRQHD